MSTNPFDQLEIYFNNRFNNLEAKIDELIKGINHQENNPEIDTYFRSIKDISSFIGCGNNKSQELKKEFQKIFIQNGQKFMVNKYRLLEEMQKKDNKLKAR